MIDQAADATLSWLLPGRQSILASEFTLLPMCARCLLGGRAGLRLTGDEVPEDLDRMTYPVLVGDNGELLPAGDMGNPTLVSSHIAPAVSPSKSSPST
jgi:hypothetical protein